MGKIVNNTVTKLSPAGTVPEKKKHLKRYPFVFLIDVSGSTGEPPDPDINHINAALSALLESLRKPAPSSALAQQVDMVDVSIVGYSDNAFEVLPWSTVENLPLSIPQLTPLNGTATGKGIEFALEEIAERLRHYRDEKIKSGMPHIIHLTDGAMNDTKPGDARWNAIVSRLSNLDGRANVEKRIATIVHFVSPKGCVAGKIEVNGRKMSGQELLAELSGVASVHEMGKELSTFEKLVKLITVVITRVTQNFGIQDSLARAKESIKDPKATKVKAA